MFIFRHVNSQIFGLLWILLVLCNIYQILGETSADSWLIFAREAKKVLNKCYKNHTDLADSWSCLKQNSLLLYDDIAKADHIPLTENFELLRRPNLTINDAQLAAQSYDEEKSSWIEEMEKRIVETFATHNVRFLFQSSEHGEARRRRRRRMMMPAMVFGMAVLGVIIIPLGFHVMAKIGGLALLFGKLALLIASITSLKRLAAHGVHYGLYHTDHHYAYGGPPFQGYWERNDRDDDRRRDPNYNSNYYRT
ncbi:uncharacterized protein LOC116336984 [Contarinia nasturtii]|uniref:uncharacterized protein LOC116336984 n=1 Tax=Contarinia nasturtii TaxID=265458 RepID=UPI0012D3C384|nr:uncharacterized protein LOC116336984 [Contarinia nasturtii]